MEFKEFEAICQRAVVELKRLAPYDTGILSKDAIKYEMPNPDTFVIYVDEDVAPYMKYTNEPWEVGKIVGSGNFIEGQVQYRTRTRGNPNEGWFDKAAMFIMDFVAKEIGGILEND